MHPSQVHEVPEFSPETVQSLTDIANNFSIEDALQVKRVRPLSSKLMPLESSAASFHGRHTLPGFGIHPGTLERFPGLQSNHTPLAGADGLSGLV